MNMFVTEEDLARRIAGHVQKRFEFISSDGLKHPYDLVGDEMEPNMPIILGYCREREAHFISEAVPVAIRSSMLNMERDRTQHNRSFAEAIRSTLAQPLKNKSQLIETLDEYYGALQLWLEHGEETPLLQDISAAVRILREYAPLAAC